MMDVVVYSHQKIKLEGFATLKEQLSISLMKPNEKSTQETELTPEFILRQFKRISDEDVSFMGFSPVWSRPEWDDMSVLPVAPPAANNG